MPLNIRSEAVNRLAERLAARTHFTKTEAVKAALENELQRLDTALPLRARVRSLQHRIIARPAQLNMGDCFAHAAARTHRTSLLFKGNDFNQTDIAPAV
jgi:antitoxin VapB